MTCGSGGGDIWLPHNQEALMAPLAGLNPEMAAAVRDVAYMLADNARAIEEHSHGDGLPTLARMRSSTQTLTNLVQATVVYQTLDYVCGCMTADKATGKFTIQDAGVYHITGRVHFDAGPLGVRVVRLVYTDSHAFTVYADESRYEPTVTEVSTIDIGTDLYIEAGGQIRLDALQASGGNLALIDTYQTHFSAFRVGGCKGTSYCFGSGC